AVDQRHAVTVEVLSNVGFLPLDHGTEPTHDLLEAGLPVDGERHPVQLTTLEAGHVERGLPQCLGRERSGVDGRASNGWRALDEGHALPEVRGLDRALLTGRAGSDHDEVELVRHEGESAQIDVSQGVSDRETVTTTTAATTRQSKGFL